MGKYRLAISSLAAVSLLTVSSCVTDPATGHRKVSRTAIGAGVGALGGLLFGGLIGGTGARIIGAGIGGVAGAAIGYQKDSQITDLREKTAGTGIDVSSTDGDRAILVSLPSNVTFDVGSYHLRPESTASLKRIARSLNQYPNSLVDIYGYSDSSEAQAYGQSLSQDRARTVENYLVADGVSAARIRSQGFGATMPVASNDTPEGRARNRRVEIKIVPISREQVQEARGAD